MANISYTSGTTAEPKGIILTHGNYVCNVLQADSLIRIPEFYKVLLFLPWDHSFAHTVGIYSFMYNGASLAAVDFGNSPMDFLRNIPLNMREIKPHVLLSVPAIAKNFRKNIEAEIQRKGRFVTFLYMRGLKFAYWYYGDGNYRKKGLKVLVAPVKHFSIAWFFRGSGNLSEEICVFLSEAVLCWMSNCKNITGPWEFPCIKDTVCPRLLR